MPTYGLRLNFLSSTRVSLLEKKIIKKSFQNFDAVQIVGLTPDSIEGSKWHMKQFYGSWITGATAGGCINHINTFSNNPQFLIKLTGSKAEYTCVIGLIQKSAKQAGSGKIGSLQIGNVS